MFPASNTWRSLEIFNHGLGDTSAAVRSASWLALSRDDSDGPQGAERMDVDTLAKGDAPSWVQVLLVFVGIGWIHPHHGEILWIIAHNYWVIWSILWIDSSRCIKSDCFPSWLHLSLKLSQDRFLLPCESLLEWTPQLQMRIYCEVLQTRASLSCQRWILQYESYDMTQIWLTLTLKTNFHVHIFMVRIHQPIPFGFNCWHLRFLQRARPTWSPKDLHAAKEKLEAVPVNSTQQLKELLRQRRLNDICLEDVVGDVRVCIDTSEFWWMRVWREIRSRSSLSQKPHFFFRSRVGRGGASL